MKQKLILSILALSLISCQKAQNKDNAVVIDKTSRINTQSYSISVEVVDSCEYVILDGTYGRSIIHKENCSNHK